MASLRAAEIIDLTNCDDEPDIRSAHSPRRPPLFRTHTHERLFSRAATIFTAGDLPGAGVRSASSHHAPPPPPSHSVSMSSAMQGLGALFGPHRSFGSFVGLASSSSAPSLAQDSPRQAPLQDGQRTERPGPDPRSDLRPERPAAGPPPGHASARSFSQQYTASASATPARTSAASASYMMPQVQVPPLRASTGSREYGASSMSWFARPSSPANVPDPAPAQNYQPSARPPQRTPSQPFAPQPQQAAHRTSAYQQHPSHQQQHPSHQQQQQQQQQNQHQQSQHQQSQHQQNQHQQNQHQQNQHQHPLQHSSSAAHLSSRQSSLYHFSAGRRSPPRHSPQHSPLLHSASRWSPAGPRPPSQQQHSPPNPHPAAYRSPPTQSSAWHPSQARHSPPSRHSPLLGNASPGQTPHNRTSPPPHSHLRQPVPRQSPSTASSISSQPAPYQQPSPQRHPLHSFTSRKSPPREPPQRQPQPHPGHSPPRPSPPPRQPSSPAQSSSLTQTSHPNQPAHPREQLWAGSFSADNRPPAKESPPQPRAPVSSTVPGPGTAPPHAPPLTRYPSPSPPPTTSSSVSLSSVYTSSPPTPTFAPNANDNVNNTNNNINSPRPRVPAQVELLPDRLRLGQNAPALELPPSSTHSPAPPSPSLVTAKTPLPQPQTEARPMPAPALTPKATTWTTAKIESSLKEFLKSLHVDHGRSVEYSIDIAKPRKRTHISSFDDFADVPAKSVDPDVDTGDHVIVRGKLHRDAQRRPEGRVFHAKAISLKSPGQRVPKYRFHHVEIAKNILSPNTPLKFIPHIRDLEDGSEDKKKFDQWIEELESMELKSGFDSSKRFDKWAATRTSEYTKLLSGYLDRWIARLGIEDCSKATLIRYMANESRNGQTITPQQKSSLLSSCGESTATPRAALVASMFTDAFNRVFKSKHVTLYDVLKQDEAVENVFDPKKATKSKDQDKEPSLEQIQQYLGTYTSLKCMICNTHSCEHGEFDAENVRRCFSIDDLGGKLWKHVERRRDRQARDQQQMQQHLQKGIAGGGAVNHIGDHTGGHRLNTANSRPCSNQCYRSYDIGDPAFANREWTENETNLLRSFHLTFGDSSAKVPCAVCPMMGRRCWEVYRRMKELGLPVALRPSSARVVDAPSVKPVTWYDRHRKVLNGDWSDHTYTHVHALREQREPCSHDGPCTAARGCPCVEAKLLCERFCRCTAESCAYKFTGCACHGSGKTCYARQKEGKPCICVQLNRECDPILCGGCGARDRADPANRDNDELHATGCQNVSLQRGKSKAVLLGQSQLEGCGYGLFTAEDIGADEFIIEYIGELITHDEGVRREARRGDVFNQESNASYLFTLLEQDGIWVDAAIYGNLSRYINHASENDKRGCNITPKILYVNGEFRIRFTAMRDIKAGEELFFNYGENFPNLTKKLLEDKASASDDDAAGACGGRSSGAGGGGGGGAGGGGRRAASQRSYNRRKGQTSGAPTKSVQSGPNNRNGNGSSSIRRRARTKGARKEAPPALSDVAESIDDDASPMEIDDATPRPASKARRNLKRKRRSVYEDDGDDENEGTGLEDADTAVTGRRHLHHPPSDDDFLGEQSRRGPRSTRRRPGAPPAPAAPPAEAANTVAGSSSVTTPRRRRGRPSVQHADPAQNNDDEDNEALQHNADDDDNNNNNDLVDPVESTETPRSRQRRVTRLSGGGGGGSTYTDGDNDADQPRRKRLRITTSRNSNANSVNNVHNAHNVNNDSDMVVDSDEPFVARPLRLRRPRQQQQHQQQQQQRVTELAAAEQLSEASSGSGASASAEPAVVALGTTDEDQGSVMSAGQFYGRRQNGGAAASAGSSNGAASRRRHVVADSDDDEDGSGGGQKGAGDQAATADGPSPPPPPAAAPQTPEDQRKARRNDHRQGREGLEGGGGGGAGGGAGQGQNDDNGDADDGEEDGSSADRNQRKRQKPARYRTEDAQ